MRSVDTGARDVQLKLSLLASASSSRRRQTASGRTTSSRVRVHSFRRRMSSLTWLYFAGFYEKDRAIPVDPRRIPHFDDDKLASFPEGYRYLAYGQSAAYKIKLDLPQSHGQSVFAWPARRGH